MPQRTRRCPGDRVAAAMGGRGRRTPPQPVGSLVQVGAAGHPPQAPESILGCHHQQKCRRFLSLRSSVPLGPEQAPRGRGGHNKALWPGSRAPAGWGISLQPAGPASVPGNGAEPSTAAPGDRGGGSEPLGSCSPRLCPCPRGSPSPHLAPDRPSPGGDASPQRHLLQRGSLQGSEHPKTCCSPNGAQQHPAPRGNLLGCFMPLASPARRDEADPEQWKSPDSGEDNSRQGERGKKIPSAIFCRFLFNLKTKTGFVREGDGGCSWKFLGFFP